MKKILPILLASALCSFLVPTQTARAQGTSFTYQGQISSGGSPVNGSNDLTFTLYNAASGGSTLGASNVFNDLRISNGLFTVTLDYGSSAFDGNARWLQIAVRPGASTGAYTDVTPRQPITATPYAITAGNLNGAVSSASLSGTYANALTLNNGANSFSGDGGGLVNVNALTLGGLSGSSFWKTTGNAGTTAGTHFLGTTDSQPLELKVNGARALRLEPPQLGSAVNVIAGAADNSASANVTGGAIGGGGLNVIGAETAYATISGGHSNRIGSQNSGPVIAGGLANFVGAESGASIGGGRGNIVQRETAFSSIGGGELNAINAFSPHGVIAGGTGNTIQTGVAQAAIAGGRNNLVAGNGGVVGGGAGNGVTADYATVAGGNDNTNGATGAAIGGGQANRIETGSGYSVIAGGRTNSISPNADYAAIGGGLENGVGTETSYATISGGYSNRVASHSIGPVIAGGFENFVGAESGASIGGGLGNIAQRETWSSSIGGGEFNRISAFSQNGVIAGGVSNVIATDVAVGAIAGGRGNLVGGDGGVVGGGEGNVARADYSTVGGGSHNTNEDVGATIGGGTENSIVGGHSEATIGGGSHNTADGNFTTIGGGSYNFSRGSYATVGGGQSNTASQDNATVGGGGGNEASNDSATVGGGNGNKAGGEVATIGGGSRNTASGDAATVPGGSANTAAGIKSFAAGNQAKANHLGAFVWGDAIDADVTSASTNQFTARASGGVRFFTNPGMTSGAKLDPGASSWSTVSDRHVKKNIAPVDGRAVLERLASVPVQQWQYQWEPDSAPPNIGPMAQDFKAAFYPGRDDKSITTLETDGVVLAAIQGLNQKVEEKDAEIRTLRVRLEKLEQLLSRKLDTPGGK